MAINGHGINRSRFFRYLQPRLMLSLGGLLFELPSGAV